MKNEQRLNFRPLSHRESNTVSKTNYPKMFDKCSQDWIHIVFVSLAKVFLQNAISPFFSTDTFIQKVLEALTCFSHVQVLNNNSGSGYEAPEVGMSGQYTLKSDVFSFGVIMLELLSGRKPFDR